MRITLPSGTPAEIVRSAQAERGLVVVPDIMGLRPLFDGHVSRIADETGWTVCAFELWPWREHLSLDERLAAGGTLEDDRVLSDAIAAADATGCTTVSVLGFCMGGMYTLKAAGTGRFHRAVPFYGMIHVPDMWRSDTQGDALAMATSGDACPLLGLFGTADPWASEADLVELESAANASVVRYEGREHGFAHDPDRPAHHPRDAADAWRRALAFLSG